MDAYIKSLVNHDMYGSAWTLGENTLPNIKENFFRALRVFIPIYRGRMREALGFYPLLSKQSFESDFRFFLVSRVGWFQGVWDFISNLGGRSEKGFGEFSPTQCDNDGRSLSLSLLSIATTTETEKFAQFLKTVSSGILKINWKTAF